MLQRLLGIGCDIVEIERIQRVFQSPQSLHKVFTEEERDYFSNFQEPWGVIAGHFAAKEAMAKALGTGFRDEVDFLSLEISHDSLGKPYAKLSQALLTRWPTLEMLISISHEKKYAVSYATALVSEI